MGNQASPFSCGEAVSETTYAEAYEEGFRRGAERMQEAILDILHAHNVSPECIARVVELPYPEVEMAHER
jgi:hypothetical protein